jgi:hypothetical protein
MGQLGGVCYRDIAQRLKQLGFKFDSQAAGSHVAGITQVQSVIPRFPIIQIICPKGHYALF